MKTNTRNTTETIMSSLVINVYPNCWDTVGMLIRWKETNNSRSSERLMQGISLYKLYTVYGNHIYLKYSIICRKCERYLIRSLWFWIGRLCDWFRISRHTRIHLEADRAPNVTPLVFYGTRSYYVTILCLLSFLLALSLAAFFDFMTARVTVCTLTSIRRLSLPFSIHFPGYRPGEFD